MELSGWYIYDFHEEFARQQVSGYKTKLQVIKPILCNQVLWDIFTAAEQTGFHVGNVTFCGADPMVQKLWVQIQSIVTLIRFPSQVVGHSGLS